MNIKFICLKILVFFVFIININNIYAYEEYMVIKYKTDDGKVFDNLEECERHENVLNLVKILKLSEQAQVYTNTYTFYYTSKEQLLKKLLEDVLCIFGEYGYNLKAVKINNKK